MKSTFPIYIFSLLFCLFSISLYAQDKKIDINKMSQEEVAALTDDQLMELSLEDLVLASEKILHGSGGTGSYSNAIQELTKDAQSKIKINGYYSINYDQPTNPDQVSTFDLHYFSLYFSAQFAEKLTAELQLAHEHAGEKVWPRTALVDYKINDAFIVRSGLFLIPCGHFNEYYDIDFINKMADRPYPNQEIAPSGWLDVGVQLRGRFNKVFTNVVPYYALYIVNGSIQGEQGGRIRKMRGNWVDEDNSDKAFGGNIGAEFYKHLSLNTSYYTGTYAFDSDTTYNLGIGGASATYTNNNLTLFGEYQFANQDYLNELGEKDHLFKQGFYALAAYKFKFNLEPIVRYDKLLLDGDASKDLDRITIGLNYHFDKVCILKINYQMIKNGGPNDLDDNMLLFQFATAF